MKLQIKSNNWNKSTVIDLQQRSNLINIMLMESLMYSMLLKRSWHVVREFRRLFLMSDFFTQKFPYSLSLHIREFW